MKTAIESLGLSTKETQVYLATLELGTALVSSIAKKAKVNRLTTYSILESLYRKGYVSHHKKKDVLYYSAVHPQVLVNQAEKTFQGMQQALPELLAMYGLSENRPHVSFYEGREGIQTLWNLTLDCQDKKIYQLANVENLVEMAGRDFVYGYIERRIEKGIWNYLIHETSGRSVERLDYDPSTIGKDAELLREIRTAPPMFALTGTAFIYDNKVSFLSSREESFGFLIESAEFSSTMKAVFDALWQVSE